MKVSYDNYFSTRLTYDVTRERLWKPLCKFLQKEIAPDNTVLELGGGYCHFINNVTAARKYVVDVFKDLPDYAASDVKAYVQSCTNLDQFADSSLDVVFASNLFEHLTREQLLDTLGELRRTLRSRGRLLIIQPNYKHSYREYFDDYTHIQIFTDVSLCDLLEASGFRVCAVFPKFLPFSVKNRFPKPAWMLALYLALPFKVLGGQMYIIAEPVK